MNNLSKTFQRDIRAEGHHLVSWPHMGNQQCAWRLYVIMCRPVAANLNKNNAASVN